jgi:hypothetical protein
MRNRSMELGAELFRQGFMAMDYLEMRFISPIFTRDEISQRGQSLETRRSDADESRLMQVPGVDLRLCTEDEYTARSAAPSTGGSTTRSSARSTLRDYLVSDRGDVPGWVLVVLMTTGLVTAIWAVAAPRLNTILRNSLDSMNNIR